MALAPALQRRPALLTLILSNMPFGDKGLAALVASPPPAGALPPPARVLTKLKLLDLEDTQVSDAGCAALAAALNSGALPTLENLNLDGTLASDAARAAVYEARDNLEQGETDFESGSESEEDEESDDVGEGEEDL